MPDAATVSPPAKRTDMRVRATKQGFYYMAPRTFNGLAHQANCKEPALIGWSVKQRRYEPGDVFLIAHERHLSRESGDMHGWMVWADEPADPVYEPEMTTAQGSIQDPLSIESTPRMVPANMTGTGVQWPGAGQAEPKPSLAERAALSYEPQGSHAPLPAVPHAPERKK